MNEAGILGLGAYVPAAVMTNDDWARRLDTTDAWIVQRTGIRRRHFAAPHETTVDLAVAAARAALADAGVEPDALAEIALATDTPEMRVPDTAAMVQHRLGARSVPAYDLAGSGCAGFLLALDLARGRAALHGSPVLVIGVELLSRMIDWSDRNSAVLFGDGAGAVVVGPRAGAGRIRACVAGTDGSKAEILGFKNGGTRFPVESAAQYRQVTLHGREVFREAVRRMVEASLAALDKAGLSVDEVALVVPHQANLRIVEAVGRALQVPPERLFRNVEEYGNTGTASVPIALWEARQAGRIPPGAPVLLASFGAGLHWAAAVIELP